MNKLFVLLVFFLSLSQAQTIRYNPLIKYKLDYVGAAGAGSGDITGGGNSGTGASVFYQKSGANLLFNGVRSTANTITVTLNAGTHDVELTFNPGNVNLTDLAGNLAQSRITNLVSDLAAKDAVLTFSPPLTRSTNTISIAAANGSTNGYLSSTDWTTFNNKVPTSRQIICGSTLTGCGDFSADRTLGVINDTSQQRIGVYKAGSLIATRQSINIIDSGSSTTTVTDNPGANRVDVTISSSSSSSDTCTTTATTSVATIASSPVCRGGVGNIVNQLAGDATWICSGCSGTGGLYVYWSTDGVADSKITVGQFSVTGGTCNSNCIAVTLASAGFPAGKGVTPIAYIPVTAGSLSSAQDRRTPHRSYEAVGNTDIGTPAQSNGSVLVNFTGTSSGGSGSWFYSAATAPTAVSNWTLVNATCSDFASTTVIICSGASDGVWKYLYKAAPSLPFTIDYVLEPSFDGRDNYNSGLLLENGSGAIVQIGLFGSASGAGTGFVINKWSNTSTYSSTIVNRLGAPALTMRSIRVVVGTTTTTVYRCAAPQLASVSGGAACVSFYAFNTSEIGTPTRIGVGVNGSSGLDSIPFALTSWSVQ